MATTQYYEAILQLRNTTDAILKQTEKFVTKEKDLEISNIKKVKNGYDYYLSSNKRALKVARKLHLQFGGQINVSRRLYSRHHQTGKLLYRLSILFCHTNLAEHDVAEVNKKIIFITSLSGNLLTGINLVTSKRVKASLKDATILKKDAALVTRTKPALTVLHPETYQEVQPENSASARAGQKIKVAYKGNRVWVVPTK